MVAGVYRHFKGGLYVALFQAKHSETGEVLVVYRHAGDMQMWVRPLAMWEEPTDRWPDGITRPRFIHEHETPPGMFPDVHGDPT